MVGAVDDCGGVGAEVAGKTPVLVEVVAFDGIVLLASDAGVSELDGVVLIGDGSAVVELPTGVVEFRVVAL